MPAAEAATNGASAAIKAESPEPVHDKILKITKPIAGEDQDDDLIQVIQPLYGELPRDEPVVSNFTALRKDVRDMPAMTVRFMSNADTDAKSIPLYLHPEAFRLAIWRKMEQVLPECTLEERRPTVVLDHLHSGDKVWRGIIDLTFTSWEAAGRVAGKLAEIEIEDEKGKTCCYVFHSITTTMPGEIYVIECLRLPVDSQNAQEVHEAFASLTASIGKVMGIGKVVTTSERWGVESSDNGVLKVYVQLSREAMAMPWKQLVLRLPTQFSWHGKHYNLRYRGDFLHEKPVLSASFPLLAGEEGTPSQEAMAPAAASKRARSATPEPDSSSTAAKKARSSKE